MNTNERYTEQQIIEDGKYAFLHWKDSDAARQSNNQESLVNGIAEDNFIAGFQAARQSNHSEAVATITPIDILYLAEKCKAEKTYFDHELIALTFTTAKLDDYAYLIQEHVIRNLLAQPTHQESEGK